LRVIFTGGGTGGHIYPAISIARGLKEKDPDIKIWYVGTRDGLEADIVPKEGIPMHYVCGAGVLGKSWFDSFKGLFLAGIGFIQSLLLISKLKPDVVVGTGGYVSGPVMAAAILLRKPTLIQEQNAYPGVTNRMLSKWTHVTALPFEEAKKYLPEKANCIVTGNPVRISVLQAERVSSRQELDIPLDARVVYVFGGSRGAERLNQAIVEAIPELLSIEDLYLIFVTGQSYFESIKKDLAPHTGTHLRIFPYLHNAEKALASADLVVARAGAMTLAEITARGLPSILIPSPNVTHNHQEVNAGVLARTGAAVMIKDRDLDGELLAKNVRDILIDKSKLKAMAFKSKELSNVEALDTLIGLIEELAERQ